MTKFDMAIYTLNQISIKGEEDASRLMGVCNFIRKTADESAESKKSVSDLQNKIAELEARLVEKTEEE